MGEGGSRSAAGFEKGTSMAIGARAPRDSGASERRSRGAWGARWLAVALRVRLGGLPAGGAEEVAVVAPAAAAFSGDAAYAHVSYLADTIGSRPAGSEREAAAAAYLAAQLTSYGYQTEIQPFTIQTYEERGARVTPLVPGGEAIETAALLYSGAGDVAGEVVDAGLGRDGDWKSGALAGRIALLERGEITFADKVANVAAAGAIAAIVFNDRDGSFTGSL